MGDVEGSDANVMVGEGNENGAMTCERFFTVGEVVEFWEGAYVSGKRSDSGEPAFVKRVEWGLFNKNGRIDYRKVQNSRVE